MKRVFAVVLPCAGVTLLGCGGGGDEPEPTPAPTPAPGPSTPIEKAWANHFNAFGTSNADLIMKDYDENSTLAIFNDVCAGGATRLGYKEYKGDEIKGFFTALFAQLTTDQGLEMVGPVNNGPVVQSGEGAKGDVFLTWRAPSRGIQLATDSFSWKHVDGVAYIKKQNIVVTESKACEANGAATPRPAPESSPLAKGWANHFAAFGAKKVSQILEDYTADSVIQVYDNTENKYTKYDTLEKIGDMFTQLFRDIEFGHEDGENIQVPLEEVEEDMDSVFLVWKSSAFPKATDTFTFDAAGKIIRQNIVISSNITNSSTSSLQSVEFV